MLKIKPSVIELINKLKEIKPLSQEIKKNLNIVYVKLKPLHIIIADASFDTLTSTNFAYSYTITEP